MNPCTTTCHHRSNANAGFALIASLSIMAILVLIGVALYSLSSVATKSAEMAKARTEAQANAKAALMTAIGELQKYTGADTRVTAPADIVDDNAPFLIGAWRSWEGLNHDSNTGRPIAEIGGASIYDLKAESDDTNRYGRFLSWLVSGAEEGQNILDPSTLVFKEPSENVETVPLVAAGSLGDNSGREVHVPTQPINASATGAGDGAYAWWISPENQKTRLKQPHQPRVQNVVGWAEMAQSHAVPDPSVFGLEELLDEPEDYNRDGNNTNVVRKVPNLKSLELLSEANEVEPHLNFHDFSVTSSGLLTNTATGGWRKDLSILSEKWDSIYSSFTGRKLPLFRYSPAPGDTSEAEKPTFSDPTADQSIFYPWSDYLSATTSNEGNPFPTYYLQQHGAVSSWQSLVDFVTSYKDVDFDTGSGVASMPLTWSRIYRATPWGPSAGSFSDRDLFNYLHETTVAPILARVQWVFNVRSRRRNYDSTNNNYNKIDLDLLVTPVYYLWNPFNVAIDVENQFAVSMNKSFPIAIGFSDSSGTLDYRRYINGSIYDMEGNRQYDSNIPGNYTDHWEQSNGQGAGFPENISLAPGEIMAFSLSEDSFVGNTGVMGILRRGYDGTDLHGFLSAQGENTVTNPDGSTTSGRKPKPILRDFVLGDSLEIGMRFDNITRHGDDPEEQGPGIRMQLGRWGGEGTGRYLGDAYSTYTMLTNLDFSTSYWDEPTDLPNPSMADILVEPSDDTGFYDSFNAGSNPPWTPVFSVVFGPRLSIGAGAGNPDDRPTKGVIQNNPFTSAVLTSSEDEWSNHPVNIPYDFSIHAHVDGNSETLPTDSINSEGYLFTGMQVGDGLSRIIFTEMPLKPMASLAELQNWNLQGNKGVPPFQYNLIGNSDASPLIKQDDVLPQAPITTEVDENLQHDDAYCANHLLFDDWFFSTVAPLPANFGSTISKDIETVYEEYLEGELQLINRAYQPILEDRNLTSSEASSLADDIINSSRGDGWLKVASRFTVEGMFNVNSTSVDAWRALLRHSRNQQVAHHTADGITLDATNRNNIVSRHSVASDVEAGSDQGMGAAFSSGSEYAGFRTLTDEQLDALASNIVDEVRARGPFLSLAEFINRQLSSDANLAIAGALQSALNSLSEDSDVSDPLAALKNEGANDQLSSVAMDPGDAKLDGAGYSFEAAAEGFSTHGFPGWIRQADVLRPIAPVLSARDDTFTIRAYGDKRDASGNIISRVWCEAVVQRSREFVDPTDEPDKIDSPASPTNEVFGRKYNIKSFRWLNEDEV